MIVWESSTTFVETIPMFILDKYLLLMFTIIRMKISFLSYMSKLKVEFNYSTIASTIQLFNYSTIQLLKYSTIQLFNYSAIALQLL